MNSRDWNTLAEVVDELGAEADEHTRVEAMVKRLEDAAEEDELLARPRPARARSNAPAKAATFVFGIALCSLAVLFPARVDAKPSPQTVVFELVEYGETEPFGSYIINVPVKHGDIVPPGEEAALGFFDNFFATIGIDDLGSAQRLYIELTAQTRLGGNLVNGTAPRRDETGEPDVQMPVVLTQTLNATVYIPDRMARAWIGELFYVPNYPWSPNAHAVSVFVGLPHLDLVPNSRDWNNRVPKPWHRPRDERTGEPGTGKKKIKR